MQEVCEPKIQIHPLVEKLNLAKKENDNLKEKLKKIEEEKIAMRLKMRKIRKYDINKEAWYHYVVGSMVTLVAILIVFVVAFKCINQIVVRQFQCLFYENNV